MSCIYLRHFRKTLLTLCEKCWKHSVCRENRNRSNGSLQLLLNITSPLNLVRSLCSLCAVLTNIPAEIKSQDAVHVLAYSVIMLNTDLHNPQVRVGCSVRSTYPYSFLHRKECRLMTTNGTCVESMTERISRLNSW
jgi:hypothetical protein